MCSKANRCIAGLATVLALMLVARPRLAAQDLIGYVEHTIDLPAFADGVTVGDWDHDRVLEVLVTLRPHEGYPLGAVACYGLHLDPLRWVLEHTISSPRGAPTNVAVGDVTGDGNEDVVFATDDGAGWGQVFVWSAGGLVWQSSPIQGIRGSGQLSLGDVDRDGRSEILLAVSWPGRYGVIYDDALGGYEASVPCSGTDAVSAAVGDVDGDGDLDALFGMGAFGIDAGRVLAFEWGHTGYRRLWRTAAAEDFAQAYIGCGDLDQDGVAEVASVSGDNMSTVAVYDSQPMVWLWDLAPRTVSQAVAVGSALNNGRAQIVFGETLADGRHLLHVVDYDGTTYREVGIVRRPDESSPVGRLWIGDGDRGGQDELIVPEWVGTRAVLHLYHLQYGQEPWPTATPTVGPTQPPVPTPFPTPTDQEFVEVFVSSYGDLIYRIEPIDFAPYAGASASEHPLLRVTSPPAPQGWQGPGFRPDASWQVGEAVSWSEWTMPEWQPIPAGAQTIGLRKAEGRAEGKNGVTHLYRHEFELLAPEPGMEIRRAVLELWSDNKAAWWWQGEQVAGGAEGWQGELELYPLHMGPAGGRYVLAAQNSNDFACPLSDTCNPQGTAFRLTITWHDVPQHVYLPLLLSRLFAS